MPFRFARLFWRQVVRQAWRHPFLTGLNVFGIALGITVFLAVQIANRGAIASFEAAAELTTGQLLPVGRTRYKALRERLDR